MKKTTTKKSNSENAVSRNTLVSFLDTYLNTKTIADSSCNGLQVEGKQEVKRIGLAVDASILSYKKALELNCDMLIVHHGLIWNGLTSITGKIKEHCSLLLKNELSLYASHLPLDAHSIVGNNAQLAKLIGLTSIEPAFSYHGVVIGTKGNLKIPKSLKELSFTLHKKLGIKPQLLNFGKDTIKSVGIVSGGGAFELDQAVGLGLDCFITGEAAHSAYHVALESKISVIYAGHYHTETVGVKALGAIVSQKFNIESIFLDVPVTTF